jgi:hypothetical protein
MVRDALGITQRAYQSDLAGDFPGVLVHLLTAFTLLLRASELPMPADVKAVIVDCSKRVKATADVFRKGLVKK